MEVSLHYLMNQRILWSFLNFEDDHSFFAEFSGVKMALKINDFPQHSFIYSFASEVGLFDSLHLPENWVLPVRENQPPRIP